MVVDTDIKNNQQLAEFIKQFRYWPGDFVSPVIYTERWAKIGEYIQRTFKSYEAFENFFKIYNSTIPKVFIERLYYGQNINGQDFNDVDD